MRCSRELHEEEKSAVEKRSKKAAEAISTLLNASPQPLQVPVVNIVGSGGGVRAMTALSGSVKGLKEMNILDCCTYIASLSGSTWYLANLFSMEGEDKITQCEDHLRKCCSSTGRKLEAETAWEYIKCFPTQNNHHLCVFVDLFGHYLSNVFEMNTGTKLSHQRKYVQTADLPFPLYTAVHVRHNKTVKEFSEWVEFTPYEYGIACYGSFLRIEDFSSLKCKGVVCKRNEEIDLSSLMATWGSAFGVTIERIVEQLTGGKKQVVEDIIRKMFAAMKIEDLRPMAASFPNILKGCDRKSLWSSIRSYDQNVLVRLARWFAGTFWNDHSTSSTEIKPDADITSAVDKELQNSDSMILLDGGVAFNDPFPPLLRKERKTDIFIVFDNSWRDNQWTHPFSELQKAEEWARKRGYKFPPVDEKVFEKEKLERCYVFENDDDPECPIVVFFPLCNPDVERDASEDKPVPDQHEIYPFADCYSTFSTDPLGEKNFNSLNELCKKNVKMGAEQIKKAIKKKTVFSQ